MPPYGRSTPGDPWIETLPHQDQRPGVQAGGFPKEDMFTHTAAMIALYLLDHLLDWGEQNVNQSIREASYCEGRKPSFPYQSDPH